MNGTDGVGPSGSALPLCVCASLCLCLDSLDRQLASQRARERDRHNRELLWCSGERERGRTLCAASASERRRKECTVRLAKQLRTTVESRRPAAEELPLLYVSHSSQREEQREDPGKNMKAEKREETGARQMQFSCSRQAVKERRAIQREADGVKRENILYTRTHREFLSRSLAEACVFHGNTSSREVQGGCCSRSWRERETHVARQRHGTEHPASASETQMLGSCCGKLRGSACTLCKTSSKPLPS